MRPKLKKLLWLAPLAIAGFAAFVALGGWVVMQLWNGVLPAVFGWREVTFWQALGLLVLCRILFGGGAFSGAGRMHHRRRIEERCAQMTPEEREQILERMHSRRA